MLKRGEILLFLAFVALFISFASAQNETIKCYSSKDCQTTTQYWCDGSSACQKLAQCSNPGTSQSECSVVDECVNCVNLGYIGCKDGQCQKIKCSSDNDCGESFTKKYCSSSQACVYESINSCYNPGTLDSYCGGKGGTGCTPCAYGCSEGVCLPGTNQTFPCGQGTDGKPCSCITSPAQKPGCTYSPMYDANNCISSYKETCEVATCKDTDGGINYYLKGSLMLGDKIASTDSCEDSIVLREESCVQDPGPNQGTMLTNIYKCPNGCQDGVCIKGEKQKEEVKCIFKNTKTEQKCYRAEYNWMYCSGTETCIVTNLEGYDGEKITWKSSCGGYAYTSLDGNNEYAEFDCSGMVDNFCASKQCTDGSWAKCYVDGSGYCVCSTCSEIIIKPVCGNNICESGEMETCISSVLICEAGKECKAPTKCKISCPEDCGGISGISAKLNEKFKLQISQQAKIIDHKGIKITFRDLLTPKCEEATTNTKEVKEKLTGYAIAGSESATKTQQTESATQVSKEVSIIKCPNVGPMAQLEIINPEEQGKKILTLKQSEAKNIYDVSVSFLEYDYASRTGVFLVSSKVSTCPLNCKCDNNGYTLECKKEEKCEEGKLLCPDGKCREKCEEISVEECNYGCLYNNKCLPIGVRVKGLYCSIDGSLVNQLKAEESCDNNFECESNVCAAEKCVSSGLIKKVLNWFKKLFSKE